MVAEITDLSKDAPVSVAPRPKELGSPGLTVIVVNYPRSTRTLLQACFSGALGVSTAIEAFFDGSHAQRLPPRGCRLWDALRWKEIMTSQSFTFIDPAGNQAQYTVYEPDGNSEYRQLFLSAIHASVAPFSRSIAL